MNIIKDISKVKRITDVDVFLFILDKNNTTYLIHKWNEDFFKYMKGVSCSYRTAIPFINIRNLFNDCFEEINGLPVANRKKIRPETKQFERVLKRLAQKGWLIYNPSDADLDQIESNIAKFFPGSSKIFVSDLWEKYDYFYKQIVSYDGAKEKNWNIALDQDIYRYTDLIASSCKDQESIDGLIKKSTADINFNLARVPFGSIEKINKGIFFKTLSGKFCLFAHFGDGVYEKLIKMGWKYNRPENTEEYFDTLSGEKIKIQKAFLSVMNYRKALQGIVYVNQHGPENYYVDPRFFSDLPISSFDEFLEEEKKKQKRFETIKEKCIEKCKKFKYNIPLPVSFDKNKKSEQHIYIDRIENNLFLKSTYNDGSFYALNGVWRYLGSGLYTASTNPLSTLKGIRNLADNVNGYTISYPALCRMQTISKKALEIENQRSINISKSRKTESKINVPAPAGLSYIPFQLAGIEYALDHPGTLFGDEMGLGKTIQALGAINSKPEINRVLVICPASLKINWRNEIKKWLIRPLTVGIARSTEEFPESDIVIINYDILKKFSLDIHSVNWDAIICDEAHYLKNPAAQRSKIVLGNNKYTRKGREKAILPLDSNYKFALSGTPAVNRPKELFSILHWLDPQTWPDFFQFALKYCDAHKTDYGWNFDGASNLSELQDQMRSSVMIRRLKEDVLKELPEKRRQIIEIPNDDFSKELKAERKAIADHKKQIVTFRKKLRFAKINSTEKEFREEAKKLRQGASISFEEIARARHKIALAKCPHVIEHLRSIIDQGQKVICFAHHLDVIKKIFEAFPGQAAQIIGSMPIEKRQEAVEKFQNDPECMIFVGSIQACREGLTLTAASKVVFAEFLYVPGHLLQAEDRAHRIGQKSFVLVQYLVVSESIDAHMIKTVVHKMEVLEATLDSQEKTGASNDISDWLASQGTEDQLISESEDFSLDLLEGLLVPSVLPKEHQNKRLPQNYQGKPSTAPPSIDPDHQSIFSHDDGEYESIIDRLTFDDLEKKSSRFTDEIKKDILNVVKMISSNCDGAIERDNVGFSAGEVSVGKFLALKSTLTNRQALAGLEIVLNHRMQISESIFEKLQKFWRKNFL
jgi:SWI/SNF-related matrix-associated actin-dependent regulator 1 of chromatin subfamily A